MPKKICLALASLSFLFLLSPAPASAEEEGKFALTITPPLVKINMLPGETWTSSIRVINNNPTATSIYAQKVDFKSGEDGGVEFLRATSESDSFLLSRWLEVSAEPISLGAFEAREIPVTIRVPETAEAGGHYAAILAGTKPADDAKLEGSGIKISSMLASLFMLNVKGDVKEDGQIREFSTSKGFYADPKVDFTLRFENSGNVHLQPQGQISIFNMFGKEQGRIDINQKSDFGNVLPKSVRKWNFSWQGDKGFLASGRYRAELVLTYGEQAKQNIAQTVYFWIVDVKMTAIIIGSLLGGLLLLFLFIRFYIRRAVRHAGLAVQGTTAVAPASKPALSVVRQVKPAAKQSSIDLRR